MTNRSVRTIEGGGRQRPLLIAFASLMLGLFVSFSLVGQVSAHAEPERAEPAIDGVVPVAPAKVEVWFDEEVKTEGTTIQVIGPGGIQVDLGDAAVDLQDPERTHVTVSLRPNLEPGAYTVQWVSVSGADNDEARGGYLFHVGAATPIATPAATVQPAVNEAVGTPVAQGAVEEEEFDSTAFGISVGVGIVFAVLIFIFWRFVRPKNPKFRG